VATEESAELIPNFGQPQHLQWRLQRERRDVRGIGGTRGKQNAIAVKEVVHQLVEEEGGRLGQNTESILHRFVLQTRGE